MPIDNEEQLTTSCVLGGILSQKPANASAFFSRTLTQPDPTNLLSQSYYYSAQEGILSPRLKQVTQSSGGIMLEPNPYLGAANCTFVYGALQGNNTHPQYPLIQGPDEDYTVWYSDSNTKEWNYVVYNYADQTNSDGFYKITASVGNVIGEGNETPAYYLPESQIGPVNTVDATRSKFPTIPFASITPYNDATEVNTTYNIWRLRDVHYYHVPVTYAKNIGYQYPGESSSTPYTGPIMTQDNSPEDGVASIFVNAIGTSADCERIYPISKDLAYTGAKLYYPPLIDYGATINNPVDNGDGSIPTPPTPVLYNIPPKTIQARADAHNCGFQLHFTHTQVGGNTLSGSLATSSGIRIYFGEPSPIANEDSVQPYIRYFYINLLPDKTPILNFFHPFDLVWKEFPLKGLSFGSGNFDIYIHFVGPNLLIGFDNDINNWNCFAPIRGETEARRDVWFSPYISNQATCRVVIENMSCVFQYGPSAFNNYNPELLAQYLALSPNARNTNPPSTNSSVNVVFTVPNDEAWQNPAGINDIFTRRQSKINIPIADTTPGTEQFDLSGTPTVYRDSRESPDNYMVIYDNPGLPDDSDQQLLNSGMVRLPGSVIFLTTIEGPQLHSISNKTSQSPGDMSFLNSDGVNLYLNPSPVLLESFDKYGDLAQWIDDWNITYSCELENMSYITSRASIRLNNMDSTELGSRLFTLIVSNQFGITLKAGPRGTNGSNNSSSLETFFQGVITNVKQIATPTGSNVILECVDVGTKLLSTTPFFTGLHFDGLSFQDILASCMAAGGFLSWYEPNTNMDGSIAVETNPYAFQTGYLGLITNMAQEGLHATEAKMIIELIQATLRLCLDTKYYPVFFYNPKTGTWQADYHLNPKYKDTLYFMGQPTEDGTQWFLPNVSRHGVLISDYEINYDVDGLHQSYLLLSKDYNRTLLISEPKNNGDVFFKDYQLSASQSRKDQLKNALDSPDSFPPYPWGYVGWNKVFRGFYDMNALPDQRSLDNFAKNLSVYLRKVYQSINFQCYVTKPLNPWGSFSIMTMDYSETSTYAYKSIDYSYSKSENTITASIQGSNFAFVRPRQVY